jgi:alpha-glucosidase
MVDPAVGAKPGVSEAYDRGKALDIWMKNPDGTDHLGRALLSNSFIKH